MASQLHGLLLVNKPSGLTSHDVVAQARRIFQTKEVGHSGTLDPLASGLMVLLIGEATKLSAYITEGDKAYRVQVKPGVQTDTLDITGQIISEKAVPQTRFEIMEQALKLNGEFDLPIPLYSAKKIDGKKLYEYAREEKAVEIPTKKMKFWDVKIVDNPSALEFHLDCSKGSFIRSWVSMLGEKLGCGATMSGLVRTKSHAYQLENAHELEALKADAQPGRHLIPLDQALPSVKRVKVKGHDETLLKNGQISHDLRSRLITLFDPDKDQLIQVLPEQQGAILALIGLEPGHGFKIRRIFNY